MEHKPAVQGCTCKERHIISRMYSLAKDRLTSEARCNGCGAEEKHSHAVKRVEMKIEF